MLWKIGKQKYQTNFFTTYLHNEDKYEENLWQTVKLYFNWLQNGDNKMTSLLVIFQNNYQVYLKILKSDLDWATTAATLTQKSHELVSADFIELALGKNMGNPSILPACHAWLEQLRWPNLDWLEITSLILDAIFHSTILHIINHQRGACICFLKSPFSCGIKNS